jgi:long-chain fatty acid transport protein
MKKHLTIICLAAAALMLGAGSARANGFYIQEMSAAGMGQAGALVAAGGKPSSQFQNAANLSFSDGGYIEFSGTTYWISGAYENPAGSVTEATTPTLFVPYLFGSYRVNKWLAIGLSEFTAFGLKMRWPSNWEGRTLAIESSLETFTLNPNISFGPFKGFAVAVGFSAMHGSFRIFRGLNLGQPAPGDTAANTVDLRGSAWGFGGNIGLMYQPAPWVRLGIAYRSGIKISADNGTVDFDVGKAFASRFPDQRFKGSLSLPHLNFAGARFWPIKDLSLELDVQWVQWSSYDRLRFELSKGLGLGQGDGPGALQPALEETKGWKDAVQLRLGMEWVGLNEHLAVRLGFLWDQNPVPDQYMDPNLPDTQRLMPCIGLGTQWSGFYLDVAYMPVFGLKRKVRADSGAPMAGTYTNMTHDLTFTVGYHWN